VARRWSAAEAPRDAQFTRWREMICEAFLALTPESDLRDGFAGTVTQWDLADLSIARIDSQRQQVQRTEHDINRAPRAGYYANFQLRGSSLMTQHGRSTVLRPGDIALVDTAEPFAFDFREDFRQLSLYIPKPLLDNQLDAPVRTATRVGTATGVGAAVRHAMLALAGDDLTERTAARLAVNSCAILAVALEQAAGTASTAGGELKALRGNAALHGEIRSSAVRYHRIHAAALADIDEHLADDDLSPAATARRLGISARLLYAVFACYEHGYAAQVRRRRLECAWRDLKDPANAHLRVIDVAVAAGFTDVTSFHRAFRREYGYTPAQARRSPED